jgi:hypothetical protein
MYSWKTIRAVCAVLLLLPIVHLTYLMSKDTVEALDASPETWAQELDSYAAGDAQAQLPEKPIVVVGGRRVKLWQNLADLLVPRKLLMRGLGDAVVEDITFNYPQLVGYYRPDTVVLLPGNSEFHLRDSKSAADLVAAISDLVNVDASYGSTRHFYIFAPLKTILHPQDHPTIDQTTRLLKTWARSEPRVVVLDANPLLSGPGGTPRGRYFRGDGVNLNEHGYLRLSMLLYTQIEADAQPARGDASGP